MNFINDFSPDLVNLGPIAIPWYGLIAIPIRWYGLLFAAGIISYYVLLKWIFEQEKYPVSDAESMVMYLFFGLVIGARLGEVFFYRPEFFIDNPSEITKIWHGGLSSHGATIGLFISYFIFCKIHTIKYTKYFDVIVIGMPLTAAFVRIGNFVNSEILGIPTGSASAPGKWGVVFVRAGENFPRHPVQLYEAVLCIAVFIVLFVLYNRSYRKTPPLFFLFLFLLLYFGGRFFIEFYKDLHVLPEDFPLSMGQVLSIIPILTAAGYFTLIFPKQTKGR